MSWDPKQYHRFREQRAAPFWDLLKWLKVRPGMAAVDLGCGTGELTLELASRLPESTIVGIDSSAEMLARAESRPGVTFRQGLLEEVEGEFDLIFSNAALHWVGDHPHLLTRLWERLRPGGQLLVQMPANFDHFSHRAAADIAGTLGLQVRDAPVLGPEVYASLLYGLGAVGQEVVLKVYPHVLPDAEAIVEWTKGTLLTAYLPQLSEGRQRDFLDLYGRRIAENCPAHGPVFYGFKRLLFWAEKP